MKQLTGGKKLFVLCMLCIIFLLQIAPASAAIGRVRTRVLRPTTYHFEPTRYARITAERLLNNQILSVSILNEEENEEDSTFAKIVIKIEWKDTDWGTGFFEGYFITEIVGTQTFSFNNTEIQNYIADFQIGDYDLGDYLGDITGVEDFINLELPEGRYSFSLEVYEVDDAEGSNPEEKGATRKVDLFVVTIKRDMMRIVDLPKYDDLRLSWQLAKIPVYPPSAGIKDQRTRSIVTITSYGSGGESQQFSVSHNPATGVFKGYPTGTNIHNGLCEINLEDHNIPFRAGTEYNVAVEHLDWTGLSVSRSSTDFSFPAYISDYRTPSGQINTLSPEFEWDFDVYESWISHYNLIVTGAGKTHQVRVSSDSHTLPFLLTPATEYTWYAVPYYSTDGKPFFEGVPADAVMKRFTTPAHDRLDATLVNPPAGAVLFAGTTYDFQIETTLYDQAELAGVDWHVGDTVFSTGTEALSYSPVSRDPALSVYCTVTDTLDLGVTTSERTVQVRDPVIAVSGPAEIIADKGETLVFSLSENQDLDEVLWYIGDDQVYSGEVFSYAFLDAGVFEVYAEGKSDGMDADWSMTTRTEQTELVTVIVKHPTPPAAVISFPRSDTGRYLLADEQYQLSADIQFFNDMKSVFWTVNGSEVGEQWTPRDPGEVVLTVTAVDVFNQETSDTQVFEVVQPRVTITSPQDSQSFSVGSVLDLQAERSSGVGRITWFVDDAEIPGTSYQAAASGNPSIRALGSIQVLTPDGEVTWMYPSDSVEINVLEADPPAVSLLFPDTDARLLHGSTYPLTAEVDSASGNVSYSWNVGGRSGAEEHFFYAADGRGTVSGTLTVTDLDTKLDQTAQFSFYVIDPEIQWESFPGDIVLIKETTRFSVTAEDIDAGQVLWILNDQPTTVSGFIFERQFLQRGERNIFAQGTYQYVNEDWIPDIGTVQVDAHEFTVLSGDTPDITSWIPQEQWDLIAGHTYQFSFTSKRPNEELLQSITINGITTDGNQHEFTPAEGSSAVLVSFLAEDPATGKNSQKSFTCEVLNPEVIITGPQEGRTYPSGEQIVLHADVQGLSANTLRWFLIDDSGSETRINNTESFSISAPGHYSLRVIGTAVGVDSEGSDTTVSVSNEVSFEVVNELPPSITMEFPASPFRLFKGTTYDFSVSLGTFDTIASESWVINGEEYIGRTISYTPSERRTADTPLKVAYTAESVYGLGTTRQADVVVLDPLIAMEELSKTVFDIGETVELSVSQSAQDIDQYHWYVGDILMQEGPEGSYTFSAGGIKRTVEITVVGFTWGYGADGSYGLQRIGEDSTAIEIIYPDNPSLHVTFPYRDAVLAAQTSYTFTAQSESPNGPVDVRWSIGSAGTILHTFTGPVISYEFRDPGVYTVSCSSRDAYGKVHHQSNIIVQVLDPVVTILKPQEQQVVLPNTNVDIAALITSAGNDILSLGNLEWLIDGEPLSGNVIPWSRIEEAGEHTVEAVFHVDVVDPETTAAAMVITASDRKTFYVEDLQPPEVRIVLPTVSHNLLINRTYAFQVETTPAEGVSVIWDIGGVQRVGSRVNYAPTAAGTLTAEVTVTDENGLTSSTDRTFTVVQPHMEITQPSQNHLFGDTDDITAELRTSGIDAVTGWTVNGIEVDVSTNEIGAGTRQVVVTSDVEVGIDHELQAHGYTTVGDVAGGDEEILFSSQIVQFSVRSDKVPEVYWGFDHNQDYFITRNSSFLLEMEVLDTRNPLKEIRWEVQSAPGLVQQAADGAHAAVSQYEGYYDQPGSYMITCTIEDIFGQTVDSRSARIRVIDPQLVFTITPGQQYDFYETVNLQSLVSQNHITDLTFSHYHEQWRSWRELTDPHVILTNEGEHRFRVSGTVSRILHGESEPRTLTQEVSITVAEVDRPELRLLNSLSSQIWLAGGERELSVRVSSPYNTVVRWDIPGTAPRFGETVTYTVPENYLAAELPITVTAEDEFGFTHRESFSVKVINPKFSIVPDQRVIAKNTPTVVQVDEQRNIAYHQWYVDGVPVSGHTADSYTFRRNTTGIYEVTAQGYYQYHDSSGNRLTGIISSDAVVCRAIDDTPPVITVEFPSNGDQLLLGESYTFTASADSSNGDPILTWTVGNRTTTGISRNYFASSRGNVDIRINASDPYGISGEEKRITVTVIDPSISITSFQNGSSFNIHSEPIFTAEVVDVPEGSVDWYVNGGQIIPSDYTFPRIGTYTIEARAQTTAYAAAGQEVTETVSSEVTIEVFDDTPPSINPIADYELHGILAGSPSTFALAADPDHPYSISRVVWTIDGVRYEQPAVNYTREQPGMISVHLLVEDERGGRAETVWNVRVKDPSIIIKAPSHQQRIVAGTMIALRSESTDVTSRSWYFNNQLIVSGSETEISSPGIGTYTLQVRGTAQGIGLNGELITRSVSSPERTMYVVSHSNPMLSNMHPSEDFSMLVHRPYRFSFDSASDNGIRRNYISINGDTQEGSSRTYVPNASGTVEVRFEARDEYFSLFHAIIDQSTVAGQNLVQRHHTQRTLKGVVYDPSVKIRSPQNGMMIAKGTVEKLRHEQKDTQAIEWEINGEVVDGDIYQFNEIGIHTVKLIGYQSTYFPVPGGSQGRSYTFTDSVSVNVFDGTPPNIQFYGPEISYALVGERTEIPVSIESSNDFRVSWVVDGIQRGSNPESLSYTFPAEGEYRVTVTAVDEYNIASSKEMTVRAVSPKLEVTGPSGSEFWSSNTFTLQARAEHGEGFDPDSFSWFMGGQKIGDASSIDAFQLRHAMGTHLGLKDFWIEGTYRFINPAGNEEMRSVRSPVKRILGKSDVRPQIVFTHDYEAYPLLKGRSYVLSCDVVSDNPMAQVIWRSDGVEIARGNEAEITAAVEGSRRITVEAVDQYGLNRTAQVSLLTVDPSIRITSFENRQTALQGRALPLGFYQHVRFNHVRWYRDSVEHHGDSMEFDDPGSYHISVRGSIDVFRIDWSTESYSAGDAKWINIVSADPPDIAITFPRDGDTLLAGRNYPFRADVSSEHEITQVWWEIQNGMYNGSDADYTPVINRGVREITAKIHVTDEYGLRSEQSVQFEVINPFIDIRSPLSGELLSTEQDVRFTLNHQGVDPESLVLLVDKEETAHNLTEHDRIRTSGPRTLEVLGYAWFTNEQGEDESVAVHSQEVDVTIVSPMSPKLSILYENGTPVDLSEEIIIAREQTRLYVRASTLNQQLSVTAASGTTQLNIIERSSVIENGTRVSTVVFALNPTAAGPVTLHLEAADEHNQKTVRSVPITVKHPMLSISQRSIPAAVAAGTDLQVEVSHRDVDEIIYLLNEEVKDYPVTMPETAETYELKVEGTTRITYPRSETLNRAESYPVEVIDSERPETDIRQLEMGDVLFSDYRYPLEGIYHSTSGYSIIRESWYVNSIQVVENSTDYTLHIGSLSFVNTSQPVTITYEVENEHGIIGSTSREVRVLRPSVRIQEPVGGAVFRQFADTPISADVRDLTSMHWTAGDHIVSRAPQTMIQFLHSGETVLQAVGTAEGLMEDFQRSSRRFYSDPVTLTVRDPLPPRITGPQQGITAVVGQPVHINVSVESGNDIRSTLWRAGNITDMEFDSLLELFVLIPTPAMVATGNIAEVPVRCTVTDVFSAQRTISIPVTVVKPEVSITSLHDGMKLPNDNPVPLEYRAPHAHDAVWFVDGNEVSLPLDLPARVQPYEITIEARWIHSGRDAVYADTDTVSVYVEQVIPPKVEMIFPKPDERVDLIAGQVYRFNASAEAGEYSDIAEMWWDIDGRRYDTQDGSVRYTPSQGTNGNAVSAAFYARDNNGIQSSVSGDIRVKDPLVLITGEYPGFVFVGNRFSVTGAAQEADRNWIVNGVPLDTNAQELSMTAEEPGEIDIQLMGTTEAYSPSGIQQEYTVLSQKITIQVYSHEPVHITNAVPGSRNLRIPAGRSMNFYFDAHSDNGVGRVTWILADDKSNIINVNSGSNTHYTYSFENPGTYLLNAEVRDAAPRPVRSYTRDAGHSWTIRVIDPDISIVFPGDGNTYSEGINDPIQISSKNILNYRLELNDDGIPLPVRSDLSHLPPGQHSLRATGTYQVTASAGNHESESISSRAVFHLQRTVRPDIDIHGIETGDRILYGQTYTFSVSVDTPGSVADISWSLLGEEIGSGSSVTVVPEKIGTGQLICTVTDDVGLITTERLTVRVVDPRIQINTFNDFLHYDDMPVSEVLNLYSYKFHIDEEMWRINGVPYFETNNIELPAGTHEVTVEGRTHVRLPDGRTGVHRVSRRAGITVIEPVRAAGIEPDAETVYVGQPVRMNLLLEGTRDTLESIEWFFDGRRTKRTEGIDDLVARHAFTAPGTYRVRADVTDIFGNTTSARMSVDVLARSTVSITRPQSISSYTAFQAEAVIEQQGVSVGVDAVKDIRWYIGNNLDEPVSVGTRVRVLPGLEPGNHVLTVLLTDSLDSVVTAIRTIAVSDSFMLALGSHADVVAGFDTVFSVELQNVRSGVNLESVSRGITWLVDGVPRGTGMNMRFGGEQEPGNYHIQAVYSGEYGEISTDVNEIEIREVVQPWISSPGVMEQISIGGLDDSIVLIGSGESEASLFSWSVEGHVIGSGRELSIPADEWIYEGNTTVALTMQYRGKVYTTQRTFSVTRSIDRSDAGVQSVHQSEEDADLPELQISSPSDDIYAGTALFTAQLEYPDAWDRHLTGGIYRWTVSDALDRYEDLVFEGQRKHIEIQEPGEYLVTCEFSHEQLGGQNLVAVRAVEVSEAYSAYVMLGLNRDVYAPGEPLDITVSGQNSAGENLFPEDVRWLINGGRTAWDSLTAPTATGEHTLTAELIEGAGVVYETQVRFRTNIPPSVRIIGPEDGYEIPEGMSFMAECEVISDDTGITSESVQWFIQGYDEPVAYGRNAVIEPPEIGLHTLYVTVTDRFGFTNEAQDESYTKSVDFNVYRPVSDVRILVNNGNLLYQLGSVEGMPLQVEFNGGREITVAWIIKQGTRTLTFSEAQAAVPDEDLLPGRVFVTMQMLDKGEEVKSVSSEIEVITEASLEIREPGNLQKIPKQADVILDIHAYGFMNPDIGLSYDRQHITDFSYEQEREHDGLLRIRIEIPGILVTESDVRHLEVTLSEGAVTAAAERYITVTDDIIELEVIDYHELVDLTLTDQQTFPAVVTVHGADAEVAWLSDQQGLIGSGPVLEFGSIEDLRTGKHFITVQATAEDGSIKEASLVVTVIDRMSVTVTPEQVLTADPYIIDPREDLPIEVTVFDRDGTLMPPENITWYSDRELHIGEGNSLDIGRIDDGHVHNLAVSAVSAYKGNIITTMNVQILQYEQDTDTTESPPDELPPEHYEDPESGEDDLEQTPIDDSVAEEEEDFSSEFASLDSHADDQDEQVFPVAAIVLYVDGTGTLDQHGTSRRLSRSDYLTAGGTLTINRRSSVQLLYTNGFSSEVELYGPGTYVWNDFSETWEDQ